MPRQLSQHRLFRPALLGMAAALVVAIVLYRAADFNPRQIVEEASRWWSEEQPALRRRADAHPLLAPGALFAGVAILPAFMLPVSPLLALCGALLGPVWGTVVAGLGMMTNAAGTFALARRCRLWVEPRVLRAGYSVPRLSGDNAGMVIIPMRLIPGIPFVFQNYLLGLAGTPKRVFFGWILALDTPCALPYVLVGAGAASGRRDLLLAGGALLLTVALLAGFLRKKRPPGGKDPHA